MDAGKVNRTLSQVIYVSRATRDIGTEDLHNIAAKARVFNERAMITGMLLYGNGHFMQVIEGHEALIHKLLGRIERDPRHQDVRRLFTENIDERLFKQWRMGVLNTDELGELDQARFEELLTQLRYCQDKMDSRDRARILLTQFKNLLVVGQEAA